MVVLRSEIIDFRFARKVAVIVPDEFDNINDAIDFLVDEYQGGYVLVKRVNNLTINEPIVLKCGVFIKGLYNRSVPDGKPVIIANCSPAITYDSRTINTSVYYGSYNAGIEFIKIDGQGQYNDGIELNGNMYVRDVEVVNFVRYSFYSLGGENEIINPKSDGGDIAIYLYTGKTRVRNGYVKNCRMGIKIDSNENEVKSLKVESTSEDGIYVSGSENIVEKNFIYNPSGNGGYVGIRLDCRRCKIKNNRIVDDRSPPLTDYSIYETTNANENEIVGNYCYGYNVEAIYVVGTMTVRANNLII